jgi:hypothetical protein
MKNIFIILATFIIANGYSQSISLQADTIQILQNSDVGSVACADIDMDGDLDLLITGNSPSTSVSSTLYKNDGNGIFTAMVQPSLVQVFAGAAEFGDVDGDGDMDLLVTGNTSSTTATANLYLNDSSGNYAISPGTPFEPSNNGDIDFGDMDGDNDLDLIMTGMDANGTVFSKLYQNNGSGSYSLVSGTPFTAVWKSSAEFMDVDNDGDLDLLICGADASDESTTKLYKNNGSGTFSLIADAPFDHAQFGDIAFGDTDNDGDQDILIVGQNANNQNIAKFYINNGTSFSLLPNTPFPGTSLHSASFADFNNDGKLDLLHIGNTSNGLIGHIYENQGSNHFLLADSTLSGSYNGTNIIADLNGDNKMDIVTTGTSFTFPIRAPKIYFNQSVIASVKEWNNDNLDLIIYPNPSSGDINIEKKSNAQTVIEIYDLIGRRVFSDAFFEKKWNIQLKEASGIYLMRFTINGKIYTRKIQLN